ncbi:hypothetical protein [Vibrio penaeicida]|uniref:hypothetical protein n=1 Tax=Vibrio penaeicida TaxID=104609 RepID=UPI0011AB66BC|nr:hypothetical protein [Vibrio penaeicida]
MTEVTVDHNEVHGFVEFNEDVVTKLKELNSEGLCSAAFKLYQDGQHELSITIHDDFEKKHFDFFNEAKIELSKQSEQHSKFFICSTLNDLTSYTDYLLNPVEAVYVTDNNEILDKNSSNREFKTYLNISRVCNLVKDASHTSKGNTYTILCGQPLDMHLSIKPDALSVEIDTTYLDELLGKDQHKEAMNSLVRESLFNLLSDLEIKSRLNHLVTHFNAFTSKLLVSYERYVRNYSFDKVRKEYREKATEYTDRLNKVFDEVATKTFAIPLGVWFATSQMQATTEIASLQFVKNISYLVMVAFLVVVVCFNLLGQFSTLSATIKEYTDLFKRLREELDTPKKNESISSQLKEIDKLKQGLDTRNAVIFAKLLATLVFSVVMLAFTIFVAYMALSEPA